MKGKGLLQVYTGDGKGKTTAAVGLAVRARSQGKGVWFLTFHKSPPARGRSEHFLLRKLGVRVKSFAPAHPRCNRSCREEELQRECRAALDWIRRLFRRFPDGVLILDEINIALRDGFLESSSVCALLAKRPQRLEVVCTGQGAPSALLRMADLVTRMRKVKHPYDRGVTARAGIEY